MIVNAAAAQVGFLRAVFDASGDVHPEGPCRNWQRHDIGLARQWARGVPRLSVRLRRRRRYGL